MRIATGLAVLAHFLIQRGPIAGQDMLARNDNINFPGAGRDRSGDFLQFQFMRREPRRKTGRDGGYRNAGVGQRADGGADIAVVNADGAGGQRQGESHGIEQVLPDRLRGLCAQAAYPLGCIIAIERGQIDATDRLEQPGSLCLFLDGAAPGQRGDASLNRAQIGSLRFNQRQIQWHNLVAGYRLPLTSGGGRVCWGTHEVSPGFERG